MVLTIRVPGTFAAQGLETLRRDQLLAGDNDGVRFLFDHGRTFSWPQQTAPVNGDPVYDLAERGASGSWQIPDGQVLNWLPNGAVDFAGFNSNTPATLAIPAAVAADLWADQQFLVAAYMRLPTTANWFVPTSGAGYRPYVTWANGESGFPAETDIVSVMLGATNQERRLHASRQLSGGATTTTLWIVVPDTYHGLVGQLAYWRTGQGAGFRLRTSAGTVLATGEAGTPNTTDFSAKTGHFGVTGWWNNGGGTGPQLPSMQDIALYRGFVENLARSARDPVAVLDGDWERHAPRIA